MHYWEYKAYVPSKISKDMLDYLMNNITMDNYILFTDNEIFPRGRGNYKAFHITTHCKSDVPQKVLIDNDFALNVKLLVTLNKLPLDVYHIKHSHMVV